MGPGATPFRPYLLFLISTSYGLCAFFCINMQMETYCVFVGNAHRCKTSTPMFETTLLTLLMYMMYRVDHVLIPSLKNSRHLILRACAYAREEAGHPYDNVGEKWRGDDSQGTGPRC